VKALEAVVSAIGNRTVDAPSDWKTIEKKLSASADPNIRRLTNSLAVKFRDPEAVRKALVVARDTERDATERAAAIRDLAVAPDPAPLAPLLDLARQEGAAELRVNAHRALSEFESPRLATALLADWSKFPPSLKSEVVNVLAGRKEWAADLLAAVGAKNVDRTALNDNTILRIQALKDQKLSAQVEKVWGRIRATPAELTALIDKMRGEMAVAPGSFHRGKLVFDNQCAKCHKFDGRGHEVGPNIEGAGRDIEYLLVNVLDPNRVIGAPYFMRTVTLLNMRVETGVLAAEDDQSITLKTENGVLKQIQKKDIDEIKVQEKSLMPEGLGNNMSVQDFRDLVRYAMTNPFVQSVEGGYSRLRFKKDADSVKPFVPKVGVSGRIALPDVEPSRVMLDFKVIAPADMTVRLLVGSKTDYSVAVAGRPGVAGKGSGSAAQPDQSSIEVKLSKGENRLTFATETGGKGEAVYLRFHDPDRRLRYEEPPSPERK